MTKPCAVEYEICEACQGTGIEEGEEWNGTPCRACKREPITFGIVKASATKRAATVCHCGDLNCEDHP